MRRLAVRDPVLRFESFDQPWSIKPLHAIGHLISGLTYRPEDVARKGLLVLRSSNIQDGVINLEDRVYVDLKVASEAMAQPGDILICVRNGSSSLIGKTAVIPADIPPATHGAFMAAFRSSTSGFARHLFSTDRYQRQVNADLGATINSINSTRLAKYTFVVPAVAEQEKIGSFLSAVDERISLLQRCQAALKRYKKGMMQRLFAQTLRFKRDDGTSFPDWVEKRLGRIDIQDFRSD